MTNLLKMLFYRIIENKFYLFLAFCIPPIVVIAAIIFTNNIDNTVRVRIHRRRATCNKGSCSNSFRRRA